MSAEWRLRGIRLALQSTDHIQQECSRDPQVAKFEHPELAAIPDELQIITRADTSLCFPQIQDAIVRNVRE